MCLLKDGEISVNGSNTSQLGHQDNIVNLNDVNEAQLVGVGAINSPLVVGNTVFHMNSIMLKILQMKGFFEGLAHKDSYEHILNIVDVCGPFVIENIIQ